MSPGGLEERCFDELMVWKFSTFDFLEASFCTRCDVADRKGLDWIGFCSWRKRRDSRSSRDEKSDGDYVTCTIREIPRTSFPWKRSLFFPITSASKKNLVQSYVSYILSLIFRHNFWPSWRRVTKSTIGFSSGTFFVLSIFSLIGNGTNPLVETTMIDDYDRFIPLR